VHACSHGHGKLRQFRTERKDWKEKCPRVAGNRLMPLIGGQYGKSRPMRRWQMKAILG
jgi:hypothetical protein